MEVGVRGKKNRLRKTASGEPGRTTETQSIPDVPQQISSNSADHPGNKDLASIQRYQNVLLAMKARLRTLTETNSAEIINHKQIEETLRKVYDELEPLIRERSADFSRTGKALIEAHKSLEQVTKALQNEVDEHIQAQDVLQSSLQELQSTEEDLRLDNELLSESQRKLERERQRYRDLFEFAPDGYMITNAFGIFQEINQAAASLFEADAKFLLGKPLMVCVAPGEHRAFSLLLADLRKKGGFYANEFTIQSRGGSEIPVALTVAASQELSGKERTLRWIMRDIRELKEADKSLRAANAYNRSLIEASLDPLVTITADGKIGDVNSATEQATGLSRDELVGTDFSDYFTDPEQARRGYRQAFEMGFVRDYELEIRHKDGHAIPVLYNATVYRDASGNVSGLFAAARDISELRRAEQALVQTGKLLERIFDNVDIHFAYLDRDFNYIRVNRAYALAERKSIDFFPGKNHFDLYPNEKIQALFQSVVDTSKPYSAFETPYEDAGDPGRGITYWDWTLQPVEDAAGKVDGLVYSLIDVSERKLAEEVIRGNARRAALLSEISQAMAEASLDEKAILDTMARMTASFLGGVCIIHLLSEDQKWLEPVALFHTRPESFGFLKESFPSFRYSTNGGVAGQVFQSRQSVFLPKVSQDQAEAIFSLHLNLYRDRFGIESLMAAPLRIQGKVIGIMSLYRAAGERPYMEEDRVLIQTLADRAAQAVTNARLYRELQAVLQHEQAMRAQLVQAEKFAGMGRMLASITHEINNPLQTIKNCLYLSQQEIDDNSQIHEFISIAYAETDRLSKLVAQLREVYHPIKSNQIKPIGLSNLIREVNILLSTQLKDHNVQWEAKLKDTDGLKIEGIADQLKQVFLNICLNAIDAMQPTGGELMVDLIVSDDGHQVGARFQDSGPGIVTDEISRLFEPFYTTKEKGLGLGLAICYDIVQRHNGHIDVESQPGQGATFTVWLPLLKDE
jgi:PAS domain S-box-containing protein